MTDWDKETPLMVAERAARRAIEAISRVGTLNSDVAALAIRVDTLEAYQRDLAELLEAVLFMIERKE